VARASEGALVSLVWVDGGEIDKLINSLDKLQGQAKTLEEDLDVELVPE
jgi:Zn-finger nucleic acid-binding protein